MSQISLISKSEFNCLFNLLEKKSYQALAKTEQVNVLRFLRLSHGSPFRRRLKEEHFRKCHGSQGVGPDEMIESEIRGEKGPVDARMNARKRLR